MERERSDHGTVYTFGEEPDQTIARRIGLDLRAFAIVPRNLSVEDARVEVPDEELVDDARNMAVLSQEPTVLDPDFLQDLADMEADRDSGLNFTFRP